MSSLPTSSNHLTVTPSGGGAHRHRRSAAISGDFDAMGLGLFSHSPSSKSMNNLSVATATKSNDNDFQRHYNFDNSEDFTNKPVSSEFSFPASTPELFKAANGSPRLFGTVSPGRKTLFHSANNLNSPIKLNHKRAASHNSILNSKNRFFGTSDNPSHDENLPEAMIDLDEILNSNLHIGSGTYGSNNNSNTSLIMHTTKIDSHRESFTDDDFLASPFIKQSSSPFVSSPLTSNTNSSFLSHGINNNSGFLFNQPIQENSDDIEEEDSDLDTDRQREVAIDFSVNDDANSTDIFTSLPPNHALGSSVIYSNVSASSSCSSLRSSNAKLPPQNAIEKTFSNSSKDSSTSTYNLSVSNTPTVPLIHGSTPGSKRSGAKANRYQIFYDQSNRISNALKVSSSESINIVRSNSSGNNLMSSSTAMKESRSLGHSSSLPSLKTNPKRPISIQSRHNSSRLGDTRLATPEGKRVNSPTGNCVSERLVANPSHVLNTIRSPELSGNLSTQQPQPHKNSKQSPVVNNKVFLLAGQNGLSQQKNISASPTSITSEVSSNAISSNDTIQSTDHSSWASQHDISNTKSNATREVSKSNVLSTASTTSLPQQKEVQNLGIDRSASVTPSIVINAGSDGIYSPSNSSTFKQSFTSEEQLPSAADIGSNSELGESEVTMEHHSSVYSEKKSPILQMASYSSNHSGSSSVKSSISSPTKSSPRRPMSSSEEKILRMTEIPAFKGKNMMTKSASVDERLHPRNFVTPEQQSTSKFEDNSCLTGGQAIGSRLASDSNCLENREKSRNDLAETSQMQDVSMRSSNRRGSVYSTITPSTKVGQGESTTSGQPRGRHSKTKSFTFSMYDLTPKISRSSTLVDDERDSSSGKKKTSRILHWFKKK